MAYNHFSEMPVWQLADEIVGDIYKLTASLPKREDYALCSQLRMQLLVYREILQKDLAEVIKKIRSTSIFIQGVVVLKYRAICSADEQSAILKTRKSNP